MIPVNVDIGGRIRKVKLKLEGFSQFGSIKDRAATAIPGTIPYRLATMAGCAPGHIVLDTTGGTIRAVARINEEAPDSTIGWISIFEKLVHFTGSVLLAG